MKNRFPLKAYRGAILKTAVLLTLVFVMVTASLPELENIVSSSTNINTALSDDMSLAIKTIKRKEEDTFYLLETIASFIGTDASITDDDVLAGLKKLVSGKDFYALEVADETGKAYRSDSIVQDVSLKGYFLAAKSGEKTVSSLYDTITGARSMVYSMPVYRDREFVGVISCYYHSNFFEGILYDFIKDYGPDASSWIIQDDGEALLSCGRVAEYKNFYTLLRQSVVKKGMSTEQLILQTATEKPGFIAYTRAGQSFYAAHMPVELNGWTLITVVPSEYAALSSEALQSLVMLLLKLILVAAAIVLYIFSFVYKKSANMRRSRQEFEALTNNVPGGVFRYRNDERQTLGFLSDGLLHIYGYSLETFRRVFDNSFVNMIYIEDRERVIAEIAKQLAQNGKRKIQYRIIDASGKIRWVYDSGRIVTDKDGNEWFYVVLLDVTRFKSSEEQMRISEERYRILVEESNSIVLESNSMDGTVFFTPNFKEKFGFVPKVYDDPCMPFPSEMVHPNDLGVLIQMQQQSRDGANSIAGDLRIRTADGNFVWFSISNHIIRDESGLPVKTISKITDIDAEKKQMEHLEDLTQRDPLTGLYNKTTVRSLVSEHLRQYGGNGMHALLFIDIDNFKAVNDNLGHLFGDKVITEIAARLKKPFRESDIVGRVGGDEFIVFLKNVRTKRFVFDKAEQICAIFRNAYIGENGSYKISGSIGISFSTQAGTTYDAMVDEADQALYYAKEHGKDHYEVFHRDS